MNSDVLRLQATPIDPIDVIVPIFGTNSDGQLQKFLGTGAFIGPSSLLVTADHVISGWNGKVAILTMHDVTKAFNTEVVERNQTHDLALLRVRGYEPVKHLSPAFQIPIHSNLPLMTFEYGTTAVIAGEVVLEPATRIGHMTRMRNMKDRLGDAGDAALELSFPALKGASGAPVVSNDGRFLVLGIVVGNISYELLPAQVETILDDKNQLLEETKFMLPQAVAVNIRHLRGMYERAMGS